MRLRTAVESEVSLKVPYMKTLKYISSVSKYSVNYTNNQPLAQFNKYIILDF